MANGLKPMVPRLNGPAPMSLSALMTSPILMAWQAFGASAEEITHIRTAAERRQQPKPKKRNPGIDLQQGDQIGDIQVVETTLDTSSAIADFAHPILLTCQALKTSWFFCQKSRPLWRWAMD